jgi:diguanylate cyclase (GGDEF)-like protein
VASSPTPRRELDAGAEGTLLLCDVYGLKAVNATHGHRSGDLVLAEIARVLARHGIAGRLGGDEFGVWVPGEAQAGLAARLVEDVETTLPVELVMGDEPLGIAIGTATGGGDVMELVEAADRDLPRSRRSAR